MADAGDMRAENQRFINVDVTFECMVGTVMTIVSTLLFGVFRIFS